MMVALAVLAADGWWLIRTRELARQTPPRVFGEAVSQFAGLSSTTASFTTQVAGLTTVFGQISEQPTSHRVTLTMTTVDGADRFGVAEVVTGSALYLRAPALAEAVGKPWVSLPLTRLAADPALVGLYQTDAIPTADAALLGMAAVIRPTGTRTIDGARTTRYVGTINVPAALGRLAPGVRQLLAPELSAVTGTMHFVAWIDGHHSFREIQTSAKIGGLSTVTTVVIKTLNSAVHITVPALTSVSPMTGSVVSTG